MPEISSTFASGVPSGFSSGVDGSTLPSAAVATGAPETVAVFSS